TSFLKGRITDVRGEDLDGRVVGASLQELAERHGQGIGFFPRRAARHPYSDGLAIRPVLENLREDPAHQMSKRSGIPKKPRDVDEEVLVQGLYLRRVPLKKRRVALRS